MDSTVSTIFNLFVICFLLLSNAFFVASEFSMVRFEKQKWKNFQKMEILPLTLH